MERRKAKPGLTSYQLKWIAVITMVIDHIGAVLFPGELILRIIGRLSFPIFCFLLTEGFCHTHNRRAYMQRLGVFALVSEVPYDLTFHGKLLDLERQNIFFTLLLGVILLNLLEGGGQWLLQAAKVLFMMWIAEVFKVDYGYEGYGCSGRHLPELRAFKQKRPQELIALEIGRASCRERVF